MGEKAAEDPNWAHTTVEPDGPRVHSLREHLECVGELSRSFASKWGAGDWAALAGRWHDLGKYSSAFQDYIRSSSAPSEAHVDDAAIDASAPPAGRKRVDHSTAGAMYVRAWAKEQGLAREDQWCVNAVAWAIAGHHAGLADAAELTARLDSRGQWLLDEARPRAPADLLAARTPARVTRAAVPDKVAVKDRSAAAHRKVELWTRMLFSALCDGDFLDTEAFFDARRSEARSSAAVTMGELAERLHEHMASIERGSDDGPVARVRRAVRSQCIEKATSTPGFFTLTVPTGGGKTLASLSFALEHAKLHGKDRLVVAIPFTSITEQSADAFRTALGDRAGVVLEHHSAFDDAGLVAKRAESGAARRAIFRETAWNRLASENWDAPIVVTTTVQLFESLFSNRSGRCRKLHRLANSVLVLDEAQTVPLKYLRAILEVLETLVQDFGTTVVVCTATQPAWDLPVLGESRITDQREIYSGHREAFDVLRRVRVRWPETEQPTPYRALATEIARERDALAIVHKRADAQELCRLVDEVIGDHSTVHLSALMCGEHRRSVLRSIRERKARGEPVRAIATQLVEAGVDIDFAVVFRALAGLDALAQAAGRCNREGRLGREGGELRVFDAETLPPNGPLQDGYHCAKAMLGLARSQRRALDLFDPAVMNEYFERFYRQNVAELDTREVQQLRSALNFRSVAEAVRIIDEWAVPVVVPWGDGPSLVSELQRGMAAGAPPGRWLRKLQSYSVNVKRELVDEWMRDGRVLSAGEVVLYIPTVFKDAYGERFGLDVERLGVVSPGATVL
ncbi:MAG: CRISPR-associated helicase Cas3' [Myxococcales bacterium]|nr:CRISPR-associated helicase Cas3' [Myxococcales bacterium]